MSVRGDSMAPTLRDGETVLTDRLYLFDRDHRRGDLLAVCAEDGSLFVRRLIGFPGELIDIVDGVVYINGCPLDESIYIAEPDADIQFAPVTVPEGKFFVLSDDREDVTDSRSDLIGYPGEKDIFGRVRVLLRPRERQAVFR